MINEFIWCHTHHINLKEWFFYPFAGVGQAGKKTTFLFDRYISRLKIYLFIWEVFSYGCRTIICTTAQGVAWGCA